MSGLSDLLNSSLGREMIQGVSRQTGQPEGATANVLSMALPLLMGAMKKNASTPQGAEGLMNALSSRHDGSILDDLGGLFAGGIDPGILNDGAGILGHVLGSRQPAVEHALSQTSGMNASAIADILKIAAPIVMGILGKQRAHSQISDPGDLGSLLGSMLGGQPQGNRDLISSLIDADGDGSVLDDVAGMMLGNSKNKGGLGDLLGGLFGK